MPFMLMVYFNVSFGISGCPNHLLCLVVIEGKF
jgi:hypothetical protein